MLKQCKARKEFKENWNRRYKELEQAIKEAGDKEQYCREEKLGDKLASMEMNSEYLPCLNCNLKSCEVKSIYFREN